MVSSITNVNIVIKNLPITEEDRDEPAPDYTKKLVMGLLKEGLEIDNVTVVHIHRKPARGPRPGIIVVTVSSAKDKKHILWHKQKLRQTDQFKSVYIEPELSQEILVQQRNTRTLLRAIGKQTDFRYSHGILVKTDRPESSHEPFCAAVERQQKEAGTYKRGRGYRHFVNKDSRGGHEMKPIQPNITNSNHAEQTNDNNHIPSPRGYHNGRTALGSTGGMCSTIRFP